MAEVLQHTPFSRSLAAALDDLKDQFRPYARTFDAFLARKRDLAKPFMRVYTQWRRETGRSFVAFVQQIDDTVPAEKTQYVAHKSYVAALYLKRTVDAPQTVAGATARRTRTPLDLLAIVIKSALPLIRPHEAVFWQSLASVSRWHQRDIVRLQTRVRRMKAIALRPDVPRLVAEGRRQVARFDTERASTAAEQQRA